MKIFATFMALMLIGFLYFLTFLGPWAPAASIAKFDKVRPLALAEAGVWALLAIAWRKET